MGAAAFVGSLILTMLVRWAASAHGFVDYPGERKVHCRPVPLGGGIVIFWVTILPIAAVAAAALWYKHHTAPDWLPQTLARHIPGLASRNIMILILILTAAALHITGLLDDKYHLGPASKLLVQVVAAVLLVTLGNIRFSFFIPNAFITTVLSVLWIVVIINSFNFLDNMDGLAAGTGIICALMILGAAWNSQQVFVSGLLLLLIGALLGFLVFNFAPAKIFLGDAGSLLIGLLIAVATVQTTYYNEQAPSGRWFAALMPLLVLAVPLYDFASVVILRLRQGKSPFVGDQQHFSHRLVKRGMTTRQAVLTIYLATACTGLGATFLHQVSRGAAILVFTQTVLIVLIIAILEQPGQGAIKN